MATFVSFHQQSKLILVNVESIQVVNSRANGQRGTSITFADNTAVEVDETVEESRNGYEDRIP
jgi:hypothetical protein